MLCFKSRKSSGKSERAESSDSELGSSSPKDGKVYDVRKFTILYGSQTGTAQEVAERIWRESKRYYFGCPIFAMDDYSIELLIYEPLIVFVCSTTGNGVEPDNMKRFWKFLLRKTLPLNSLSGLRFAVLGLGDSSYEKFNFAAKKLHRRLLQLGGTAIMDVGLADDQHDLGTDFVVDSWLKTFWEKMMEMHPLPHGVSPLDKFALCPPRWNVSLNVSSHFSDGSSPRNVSSKLMERPSNRQYYSQRDPCYVNLESNIRTTAPTHFQDVRLITFHAPDLRYEPGDVVMMSPCNSSANVERFFNTVSFTERHKLDSSLVIRVLQMDQYAPVPKALQEPLLLRKVVESYWDLNIVPRRYFFELLSYFSTSELEQTRLQELISPEGQQDFLNYCTRPRRTTLEVLNDFPYAAANIPLPYMFELFRPIQPRAFSIASSPRAHLEKLQILVAVVQYKTRMVAPRIGLCSNWLKSLLPGEKIAVWVKKGSLDFPKNLETPVIMIGPGTGVAPFRSFIQDRVTLNQAGANLLYLFFGCRRREADFHFREEWIELEKTNKLTVFCAFSREREEKVYVQHLVEEHAGLVWHLLHTRKANLYLAGRSEGLPNDIRKVLYQKVALEEGGLSEGEAADRLQYLETSGKIQMETWS